MQDVQEGGTGELHSLSLFTKYCDLQADFVESGEVFRALLYSIPNQAAGMRASVYFVVVLDGPSDSRW